MSFLGRTIVSAGWQPGTTVRTPVLIAVPIRELERASEQVASGDLGTQLAVYSNDEIGGLAQRTTWT